MFTRRRPSAATLVAIVTTFAIGAQTSFAAGSAQQGPGAPDPVSALEVTATDATSVTIAWQAVRDRDVTGYTVFLNGAQVGTQTPDQVKRWRDRDSFTYTLQQLTCGTGYTVAVDTFDRGDHHSKPTTTTVSTAACPDKTAPSAPTGIRQVAATETSAILSWTPSSDNVGVVEYGLYASGLRVATSSDANATLTNLTCNTSYLVALDAADAAGNRSPQTTTYLHTSACPSTNKPPSTPTLVRVTKTTDTTVALSWTASTDDVGVTGYGLYLSGSRTSETAGTTGEFTGLKCGTTYTLGVDAKDAGGLRSAVATLSAATSPCSPPPSSTGAVSQTIVNGSTLPNIVNWRAVYDANGDGKEDDPGSIQFLIDGKQVLSEINAPFGDTFANGTPSTSNGSHAFQVRALNDAGTLLASNTVTATITTSTPPTGDTIPPTQPGNLKVASASATGVAIAWNPSTDNVGVTGYDVYRNSSRVGTTAQTTASFNGLTCGTGYPVGVDAFDAAGNSSAPANMTITTSACADTQPPTAPGNVTVSTRTTTSISLTWAPSTDNTGVAGYGIYNGGELANTTTGTTGIVSGLTCGTNYTLAIDAFDASGNSSPKSTAIMVSTLPCTDTTAPTVTITSPANGSTVTGTVTAAANATDNVAVVRVEFFRDGVSLGNDTTSPYSTAFNTTTVANGSHTFGARAYDASGNVGSASNVTVTVSNVTPPPSGNPACPLPAYPDASCTGVPAGTPLTPSGGMTITTAGTVVDGRDITGTVVVNAPNVTIRNSRIRNNGFRAIESNSTGLVVEDSEIINRPVSGQPNCHNGIGYGEFTVRRTEITGCENAADMGEGNVVFTDNYVHDLDNTGPSYVFGNDPHTDGIQIAASSSTSVVIRHNWIDPVSSGGATSAIIMSVAAPNANVWIEDNYLDGRNASYAIYVPRQQTRDIYVNRNRMYRGVYGYTACVRLGITVTEFNDNRDAATGVLLTPDNGAGGSGSN